MPLSLVRSDDDLSGFEICLASFDVRLPTGLSLGESSPPPVMPRIGSTTTRMRTPAPIATIGPLRDGGRDPGARRLRITGSRGAAVAGSAPHPDRRDPRESGLSDPLTRDSREPGRSR